MKERIKAAKVFISKTVATIVFIMVTWGLCIWVLSTLKVL